MAIHPNTKLAPLLTMRDAVLACPSFVAQCEKEDLDPEEQVKLHSYRTQFEGDIVVPDVLERPFVIIKPANFEYGEHSAGCMFGSITIHLLIEDKTRGNTWGEIIENFWTYESDFLRELANQTQLAGKPNIRKISMSSDAELEERRHHEEGGEDNCVRSLYEIELGADL
jgi:hypothetical protein